MTFMCGYDSSRLRALRVIYFCARLVEINFKKIQNDHDCWFKVFLQSSPVAKETNEKYLDIRESLKL